MKKMKFTPKTIGALAGLGAVMLGAVGYLYVWPMVRDRSSAKESSVRNYTASLDVTDAASEAFSSLIGSDCELNDDLEAVIYLTVDNGTYSLSLDTETLGDEFRELAREEVEDILLGQVVAAGGATDAGSLQIYASNMGYASWNETIEAVWSSVEEPFEALVDGEVSYSGSYTSSDGTISFINGSSVAFTGTADENLNLTSNFSFDRKAPSFLYSYYKRGTDLMFVQGGEGATEVTSESGTSKSSDNGIVVNVYVNETEATQVTVTAETEPTTTTTEATTTTTTTEATTTTTAAPETTPETTAAETNAAETKAEETKAEETKAEGEG